MTRVTNANGAEMRRAIDDFTVAAKRADVALFFYAGHGIAEGSNYWLIPTDGRLTSLEDVMAEKLDLQRIWEKMGRIKGASVMLLDAGRTNPFRGVAELGPRGCPDERRDRFLDRAGHRAVRRQGTQQPLCHRALLKHIATPGLSLEQVFKRVRVNVMRRPRRSRPRGK